MTPNGRDVGHGSVVIAAITSCTNTSNPSVMVAAGLLAKRAVEAGLGSQPWVKTSLAPGSRVVTDYLDRAGLTPYLEKLGFNLVGYGCTTCIGNSGPLPDDVAKVIDDEKLNVVAVLSGNRNFEGRIHPQVRASYLASPPLVVAYALAGRINFDPTTEPLGEGAEGPVFLRDLWPSPQDVAEVIATAITEDQFIEQYGRIWEGDDRWRGLPTPTGPAYEWDPDSTYVREPPFFSDRAAGPVGDAEAEGARVDGARILEKVGDSITTDHISPAGAIRPDSPAGRDLIERGVQQRDFNSYGARRGNHEVMMRGTFANVRLRNELAPGTEGWWTTHLPSGEVTSVYEAAMRYRDEGTPLGVLAGKEYGSGSSRDWAAKGPALLGVAVRARRIVREDPPSEPRGDGDPAPAVQAGGVGGEPRPDGAGDVLGPRPGDRDRARAGRFPRRGAGGRFVGLLPGDGPDRSGGGGRDLRPRRHPPDGASGSARGRIGGGPDRSPPIVTSRDDQVSSAVNTGSVVGADGQSVDSTVTAISSAEERSASR